jgi:acyl-CoA thioester hydrolase
VTRHVYLCPLRWSDMDAYRHINNVAFLRLLEEARIDWLFHGPDVPPRRPNEGLLVVHHEIDYRRQLDYRQAPVPVETWVSRLANASFTISYEVFDGHGVDRTVYATAKTMLACVDLQAGHTMRLTAERKAFLGRYLEA